MRTLLMSCPDQKRIVTDDACVATSNPLLCAGVYYGVMSKGLYPALQSYGNLVRDLLASRRSAAGGFEDVQASVFAGI